MEGTPTTFWGKLEKAEDGTVLRWHPLLAHCADVAACAEAILSRTVLRRRLARLANREDLDDSDIARLAALAAFHDIGKFNVGFQRKADANARDVAGHVAEVLDVLGSDYAVAGRLRAALPSADLGAWADEDGAWKLLIASIGHHGRPMACGARRPRSDLWESPGERDPIAGISSLTAAVRSWFPRAFAPGGSLPASSRFQHGFAGLIMLADWLGSDRHDDMFPFVEIVEDRIAFARARAQRAVTEIGLDVSTARASLPAGLSAFARVSSHPPRDAQTRTVALPCEPGGSLTVLESETGSGKTEAALARFLQMFEAGLVDGMTFALPTRTAATQIHRRVVTSVSRAFPDAARRPAVVLAVPGYLMVDDRVGRRLPGFEVLWADERIARDRHRGWPAEQPKRYLAGTVVVGTIDQVLLSSLRVGHAHLRATALLRHLLVVDEVHASDAYMNRVLEEVLRFHLGSGGHALLMSATLGSHVRARLEAAGQDGAVAPAHALSQGLAQPYPVVHHSPVGSKTRAFAIDAPGNPKRFTVELASIADDPGRIAHAALSAARAGARVLVLRNTVAAAVQIQQELEQIAEREDEGLFLEVASVRAVHHARFSRVDRGLLDAAIEARFGDPKRTGGVVAVATQTVQQSLDLDADLMFTDLAPMDVLLQRFGRVHRHSARDPLRPAFVRDARIVVLVGERELGSAIRANGEARGEHGVGTVYEDLTILEATRRLLLERGRIDVPSDNRELVERTTHPEALAELAGALGDPWPAHRAHVAGKVFARTGLAQLNAVDRTQEFGEYTFSDAGLEERIASRLGESDRRVRFEEAVRGPFGELVSELNLPGWLARRVPNDPDLLPTDVRDGEGSFGRRVAFDFGGEPFVYDRLGLRRMDPEHSKEEDIADA